ncbi:MAG TPA: carboxypeptidase-like regulatory domain-containing protein [Candidatus Acidoferrum sp.]
MKFLSLKFFNAGLARLVSTLTVPIAVLLFSSAAVVLAQDSAQSPVPPPPAPSAESSSKPNSNQSTSRHSNDFLVRGTVFTQDGFALPGAELRIRRSAEKKYRWQTVSNSRGDFAVRVKMGTDYEVTVRAKGFSEQSLPVDAKTGDRFKDLVFRLQHQEGKKS